MEKLKKNQGLVMLTIGNKSNKKQNTITHLGDAYFSAKSKQYIGAMRGIEQGFDFIQSELGIIRPSSSSVARIGLADSHNNLTIYLLNLSQLDLDNLTAESSILPIYTDTYDIDNSKIVGWASMDRISSQAKQGIFAPRVAETILDDFINSLAWQWGVGKTVGSSFNCIAIGFNLVNTNSSRFNGMSIYRGLESNDVFGGEVVAGGFMLRPNIAGITGPNEILLGGRTSADYDLGRVKYDMVSKTSIELNPVDKGYDFPLSKSDSAQVIIGDRLFYFKKVGNYLHYYDMTTGTHTQSSVSSANQKTLFSYNGYLYTYYNTTTLRAYNPVTLARVSSADIVIADLNLPVDLYKTLSFNNITIGNHRDGYIITYSDNNIKQAIIRADLLLGSSIVCIIPKISSVVNYTINNEVVFFDYNTPDDIYKDLLFENAYMGFGTNGVKYSKYAGNMLSFLKYTEPQTIASDDIITVEYAYKYGV